MTRLALLLAAATLPLCHPKFGGPEWMSFCIRYYGSVDAHLDVAAAVNSRSCPDSPDFTLLCPPDGINLDRDVLACLPAFQ